jgi:hypothetical protein
MHAPWEMDDSASGICGFEVHLVTTSIWGGHPRGNSLFKHFQT